VLDLWDGTLRGPGRFRQFSRSCCQDAREDPTRGRSHPPSSWGLRSFYRILAPVLTPDIPGHEARARQDPFFRPGLSALTGRTSPSALLSLGCWPPWSPPRTRGYRRWTRRLRDRHFPFTLGGEGCRRRNTKWRRFPSRALTGAQSRMSKAAFRARVDGDGGDRQMQ